MKILLNVRVMQIINDADDVDVKNDFDGDIDRNDKNCDDDDGNNHHVIMMVEYILKISAN